MNRRGNLRVGGMRGRERGGRRGGQRRGPAQLKVIYHYVALNVSYIVISIFYVYFL